MESHVTFNMEFSKENKEMFSSLGSTSVGLLTFTSCDWESSLGAAGFMPWKKTPSHGLYSCLRNMKSTENKELCQHISLKCCYLSLGDPFAHFLQKCKSLPKEAWL